MPLTSTGKLLSQIALRAQSVASRMSHQLLQEGKMEGMTYFGEGIVDTNGDAVRSFRDSEIEAAKGIVRFSNEEDFVGTPNRLVELFYKDEQP